MNPRVFISAALFAAVGVAGGSWFSHRVIVAEPTQIDRELQHQCVPTNVAPAETQTSAPAAVRSRLPSIPLPGNPPDHVEIGQGPQKLMIVVTPRIIISGDDEEKLGIAPP